MVIYNAVLRKIAWFEKETEEANAFKILFLFYLSVVLNVNFTQYKTLFSIPFIVPILKTKETVQIMYIFLKKTVV